MPAAGEVEQFVYCAHNWQLARQGVDPEGANAARGMREHDALGKRQAAADAVGREAKQAWRWMFRILGAAGAATFLTLEVIFLRGDPLHFIFLPVALVMVAASAALLVIGTLEERRFRQAVRTGHLLPAELASQGMHGERVLEDPAWGIAGSPDYVMETAHGPVPVEVKTGHTPDRPYPSHEMQLACYLRLVEVERGQAPEYGLLTYPDGVFRVAWDDGLRDRLRQVLERMAEAEATGKADRDHEHPGRCRGCARREACDQRLV